MAYDLIIQDEKNFYELTKIISTILNIDKNNILPIKGSLIDYIDENGKCSIDYREDESDDRILCEVFTFENGDFLSKIEIDSEDEKNSLSAIEFASKFAKMSQSCCLIGSEDDNPYQWIYFDKNGDYKEVYIDRISLDDKNEFVISRDV